MMWFVKRDSGWVLEDERPTGPRGTWLPSHLPALPHAVEVHTGTGSNPAKWETLTVLACDKHGELLVETSGTKSYTYADRTIEGRRLVRSVIKAMKVLAFLGRKAAVARAKAEKNRAEAKAREGRDGECQICEGRFIAEKGTLVLHGYERPGIGYVVGRCFGVKHVPWEVGCSALREWVEIHLTKMVEAADLSLRAMKNATMVYREKWTGEYKNNKPVRKLVPVYEGEPGFEDLKRGEVKLAEMRLENVTKERARQAARLASWKPTTKEVA